MVQAAIWETASVDPKLAETIACRLDLPLPLAHCLIGRGFSEIDSLARFLEPSLQDLSDPFLLPDMERAVHRVWIALDRKEPILIFGDYDVDGLCSTALLVRVLTELGGAVTSYIPHRVEDGYGLQTPALEKCIRAFHPKLIVTVDCGTSSVEAVELAREHKIDTIVTDHHEPSSGVVAAYAVINPKLGSHAETRILAGVGVAFKLCHALVKQAKKEKRNRVQDFDLRPYLELVAIGTISDVVPLEDENRVLASYGLGRLSRTQTPGLKQLQEVAKVKAPVKSYHIGYVLGPRINAAGRMGDARRALELLLAEGDETAREIALELNGLNEQRRSLERRMIEEAVEEVDAYFDPDKSFVVVVSKTGWNPGIIGIVASRLATRYSRPCVVIAVDESGCGRGSCRSIRDFDLVEHLSSCSDLLIRYGGHAQAAGLDIDVSKIDRFREQMNILGAETLREMDLSPVLRVDAWVDFSEIHRTLYDNIQRLQPFGCRNPAPVWASRGIQVVGEPCVVGKGHLKMKLRSGGEVHNAIGFGMGSRELPSGPMDVAFQLQINDFRDRKECQLSVQDFRPSSEVSKTKARGGDPIAQRTF